MTYPLLEWLNLIWSPGHVRRSFCISNWVRSLVKKEKVKKQSVHFKNTAMRLTWIRTKQLSSWTLILWLFYSKCSLSWWMPVKPQCCFILHKTPHFIDLWRAGLFTITLWTNFTQEDTKVEMQLGLELRIIRMELIMSP